VKDGGFRAMTNLHGVREGPGPLMSSNFCPHLIFKFGDLIEFSMLKD